MFIIIYNAICASFYLFCVESFMPSLSLLNIAFFHATDFYRFSFLFSLRPISLQFHPLFIN